MTAEEREAAIRRLLPLVRRLARRVAVVAKAPDLDDLVGDGSLGLIRAVDRFDAAHGASLEAYARRMIVGAMLNGLRRRDPVSERVRRTMRCFEERRLALAQERGTMPGFAELERADPAFRRARVAVHVHVPLSLDAPLPLGTRPAIDRENDPALQALARVRSQRIGEAIALLPERQRRIVALHYGRDLSLHAIGRELAISPQRVSQLHLLAIARLRHAIPPA